MRLIVDVEPVVLDGRGGLDGLKEFVRARAGEDGDAVRLGAHLVAHVLVDALHVALEALALRAVRLEGARALRELLAQEALEVLPAVLVGLRVQIEADDRQPHRLELRQPVYNLLQSIALGCTTLCHSLLSPLSFGSDSFLERTVGRGRSSREGSTPASGHLASSGGTSGY
jgi:hypothetical protein